MKKREESKEEREKKIKELEKKIKELEELEEKLKKVGVQDLDHITKPCSGNITEDVFKAIEKYIVPCKPSLKPIKEYSLLGESGNWWRGDIVIKDRETNSVEVIIECKNMKEETSSQTFKTSHIPRAYMILGDLRNWKKALKFVIFTRIIKEGRGKDYKALFNCIGAEMIDWSDDDWLCFVAKIVSFTK